ncbi:hypothetical protein R3P38DRAFT_2787372 [Favolaschia claudopus]|uniref:Uncharacterized protein n=1 Tax=Favolaschia claudopus TaxID=2862362 RepID=A0AAW0AQX0_9AGAR
MSFHPLNTPRSKRVLATSTPNVTAAIQNSELNLGFVGVDEDPAGGRYKGLGCCLAIAHHDLGEMGFRKPRDSTPDQGRKKKAQTATNVLTAALRALGTWSSHIPVLGMLNSVIEPVLALTEQVQVIQKSDNQEIIGERLRGELLRMQEDLGGAHKEQWLGQFFNSRDNAAMIKKHNNNLLAMITENTLMGVDQIMKKLKDIEITGGHGGSGGAGHEVGGKGGVGGGPRLSFCHGIPAHLGNISGGYGGSGGSGMVGGMGGTGNGPIIKFSYSV